MTSVLSGSLARAIYGGMKLLFLDATLLRDVAEPTSPSFDAFDPPAPTTSSFPCKAIRDNYSNYEMASGLVQVGDAKILILAQSLSVTPTIADRVTISGTTFRIINVLIDPATALWTCQGRL